MAVEVELGDVAAEFVVVGLVDVAALGCAAGCRCGAAGVLRAGVVRRFVVCANDAGESASKSAIDINRVRGNTNEVRGNGLKERFIRELTVLNASREFRVNDSLPVSGK